MKVHNIFVEPANYTHDLIENVYQKLGVDYSFMKSDSVATDNNSIVKSAQHLFDKNSFFQNTSFLWNTSKENDLVIINGYNSIWFLLLWSFSIINSFYVGIESDTPYTKRGGIVGFMKKIFLTILYSNKRIIGLPGGTGLHRDLFSNFGMPNERIFLLPMMVDNNKYAQKNQDYSNKEDKEITFLFVGRLAPEKNVNLLIKAFNKACFNKNAKLHIIGDGICKNELNNLIDGNSQIKLLGKKFGNELLESYHEADVFILPSSFEPWGLVVNEAIASGLPVVCSSAVGAAHDLVLKPDTGWVFKNNNSSELTLILQNLIENTDQIFIKAKKGREFMVNYWNYELYIKCFYKIMEYVGKN